MIVDSTFTSTIVLLYSTDCTSTALFSPEEGSLEAMTIPWSLSGLCIHNCMTALCLSGLVHRDLTMAERCENAVSGFVGMDLFKILADRKCKAMELPAGSCFYAGQTLSNAQSAALATMVVTLTKPPWYNCFDHGNGRLTEISVEQWFAGIRQQSSNSQVSARSYFLACARQNLRAGEVEQVESYACSSRSCLDRFRVACLHSPCLFITW